MCLAQWYQALLIWRLLYESLPRTMWHSNCLKSGEFKFKRSLCDQASHCTRHYSKSISEMAYCNKSYYKLEWMDTSNLSASYMFSRQWHLKYAETFTGWFEYIYMYLDSYNVWMHLQTFKTIIQRVDWSFKTTQLSVYEWWISCVDNSTMYSWQLYVYEWWISCVYNSTVYSLDTFTTQYHLTTVCLWMVD